MLAGLDGIGGFVSASSSGGGTSGSFAVSVSPTSVSKSVSSRGVSASPITPPVTATASGGAGGYAYAWSRVSGDAGVTANTPAAASTSFSATLTPSVDQKDAEFVCTVTDAASVVVVSEIVEVSLSAVFW